MEVLVALLEFSPTKKDGPRSAGGTFNLSGHPPECYQQIPCANAFWRLAHPPIKPPALDEPNDPPLFMSLPFFDSPGEADTRPWPQFACPCEPGPDP